MANNKQLCFDTAEISVNTYGYANVWKDQLTSYRIGDTTYNISYDGAGHPLDYMGASLTWNETGSLTSIQTGTNPYMASGANQTIAYTYLSDGTRRTKTVNGRTTTYHYNNGLLLSETTVNANGTGTAETLSYYYGSTGKLASVTYQKGNNTPVSYFYAYNGQGDVIALYRSSDSVLIGTYEYDLWGRPVSVKEATAGIDVNGILTKTPFRYRGYYYDEETGFYYLNARYYDPQVRRFISADGLIVKPGCSTQGYNLYVYCSNNPINMTDESGCWPEWANKAITAAIIVAGAVVIGAAVIASAGAAGMAVGVLATSLGASGAVASAAATVGSVGTVVAGSTIIACGASDAVECVTGTNLIRDGLMNGNQDAYDLVNMGAYIAGGMALEAGQMYPKVPAKESRATSSPYDLEPTHSQTLSNNKMNALINDIKGNGIKETIKYVEYNGRKYVVDGHHRLLAAKKLGLTEVPIEEVQLPYAGYNSVDDLLWFE